jgi:protein-S-isoprenylcysteine O-methyltransferase Ste14
MAEIESTIWKFVREDLPPAEFEQWVYAHPELEEFWGRDFYMDVISSGFVQEQHLYEVRESLRYWMLTHNPPACDCVTWKSPHSLMETLWESSFHSRTYLPAHFDVLKQRDEHHQLLACQRCQQNWYLGIDKYEADHYLLRLSAEQIAAIHNAEQWPADFDSLNAQYEDYSQPMIAETNSYKSILQRLRVPLGFVTAILFLVFSQPSWRTILIGAPIAFLGVAMRAWASGHLRKNAELAISGPYAYTRNPLYFGSFVLAIGIVIAGGSWWLAALLLGFFLAVYLPVMQAEAAHMHELFPNDFAEYEQNVPLFLPRLTAWKPSSNRFDQALYLKYREYRALLGVVIVIAILILKIVLR